MMPGRQRCTGMYRNVDFTGERQPIAYERHYRLATAKLYREGKDRPGRYRRQTKWWMGYPKKLPKKADGSIEQR